jgi:uncharacterized protein YndB with AHSA1/START domain
MTIEATGRVVPTQRGADLELTRSLALPIEEAWEYLTDTALTEQWFGPWEGDGRVGGSVRIRMRFETNEPAVKARILHCEAPRHLAVHTSSDYGSWQFELHLSKDGVEDTLLRFVHHLAADDKVSDIGPGWEYYLDLLVAATESTEQASFDQYYPALCEYYETQLS